MKVKIVADYFAINKKGKEYAKGDEVEINEVTAKELIAFGRVVEVKTAPKPHKEEDK